MELLKILISLIALLFYIYMVQERLTVGKNVSVEQSFEDLEAIFEPGDSFKFDVVVQCQQSA